MRARSGAKDSAVRCSKSYYAAYTDDAMIRVYILLAATSLMFYISMNIDASARCVRTRCLPAMRGAALMPDVFRYALSFTLRAYAYFIATILRRYLRRHIAILPLR